MEGTEEKRIIIEQIKVCNQEMSNAYEIFNQVSDPNLTDSYIYRIKALECQHSALLNQYKQIAM